VKDPSGEKGAEGAREQAEKRGLGIAAELSFVPGTFDAHDAVRRMGGDRVDAVLYFGVRRRRSRSPVRRLGKSRIAVPRPGHHGRGRPARGGPGFLHRVYLAARWPLPTKERGRWRTCSGSGRNIPSATGIAPSSSLAYTGAILLEEGLRRSGKGVTREKLVDAVGNVWKLQTGVTPR